MRPFSYRVSLGVLVCVTFLGTLSSYAELPDSFLKTYCYSCHSSSNAEAGLNLETLDPKIGSAVVNRWIRIYDRLQSGEMPPRDAEQPMLADRQAAMDSLEGELLAAEKRELQDLPKLRRLTRSEYENTIRDLFDMPGIALTGNLPADGQSYGFDKHPEALDISHVNIAKYLEAADHILNYSIVTRPEPPVIHNRRISLVNRGGFVAHIVMNGDGVLLKNGQPDPEFPPAAEQNHLDQGAHERWGSFSNGASVGLFRHEDESVSPYFIEHVTIYPAKYRVRTSLWSFQWDQGKMLPGRGTEAARLSVVQLTGDGRGGQHPSYVLGYFNAPVGNPLEHELTVWMNHNELIGFNTASLAPAANYYKKKRAMEFTGPGIVVDWLDVEGPLYDSWPPVSHKRLFGNLPITQFKTEENPNVRIPIRKRPIQIGAGMNRPDPEPDVWSVQSEKPLEDADQLLADFLPKLFRRPVSSDVRNQYLAVVQERLKAGDSFEFAMRTAYRNALVAPDFLLHIEGEDKGLDNEGQDNNGLDDYILDGYGLACRLSYFLWNSLPDDELMQLAASGRIKNTEVIHQQVERMLADPRSTRFVNDFVGQWLKLHQIANTDPDKKLYPEFSPYLQDSMVAETRAYFRELLDKDLSITNLLQSDFVMVNEKLATHYGIPDVSGTQIRRVSLPDDCPRGGLMTQASILKITSNGTTTSPVPRGAFVIDRLYGEPPEPPPASVSAIEPDVRGTTSVREQLAKHRDHAQCASCHQRIDPPGFALEAFDVIGGFRKRYRSIGEGESAERGSIDPMIGISFKLGQLVDASGQLIDGRPFKDIREYKDLMAADSKRLLLNLAKQFALYSTGRTIRFSDRKMLEFVVERTLRQNGGVRTLLHELVVSPIFTGDVASDQSANTHTNWREVVQTPVHSQVNQADSQRFLMAAAIAPVITPALKKSADVPNAIPMPEYTFDGKAQVNVRVVGLFVPERVSDFEKLLKKFPEVRLDSIDFQNATAVLQIATNSDLFRNANPDQVFERLDSQIRQLSTGLFSLKPMSDIPSEMLQREEFSILGLDCSACSLAVHDILVGAEGVSHAKASFREGKAVAWIDSQKTDRNKLESLLQQRGVTLRTQGN